ncbi:hypothetical protein MNV49_003856 [Pseudohyphozyma bogoriensis]|nr:hypothetical protein MNV49_003856 [Pseudohyphozyma bogoriensis]
MNYEPPTPRPEHIKGVTVEEIVSGTRCSPLTLKEFEGFLIHEEHSVENLQFVVWYRSYCQRFAALAPEYQALAEPPERFSAFDTPSVRTDPSINEKDDAWWLRLLRRRSTAGRTNSVWSRDSKDKEPEGEGIGLGLTEAEKVKEREQDGDNISLRSAAAPDSPRFSESTTFPSSSNGGRSNPSLLRVDSTMTGSDSASMMTSNTDKKKKLGLRFAGLSPLKSIGSRKELPEDTPLPFLDEVQLILTTFILPGSSKELNITAKLRKHVLKSLQPVDEDGNKGPPITTHPDVFKEVADHTYNMMERSLPHYLQWAKGNTNTPKMLFWTAVGITDFMIGIMQALLIMFYVRKRGWRIFSCIFIDFGVMQAYSASRYFCSQVHGRTARQLYPWELTAELSTDDLLANPAAPAFVTVDMKNKDRNALQTDKVKADLAATMPFLFEDEPVPMGNPFETNSEQGEKKEEDQKPSKKGAVFRSRFFASLRKKNGDKIPVFGPERVVEDPYIKELHDKQMKEILIVGFVVMLCCEAVIMSIPEQVPR